MNENYIAMYNAFQKLLREDGHLKQADIFAFRLGWRECEAAQQMLALDPPSALVCSCGSVAGVHCDWCPCANTAVK